MDSKSKKPPQCTHAVLSLDPSPHAAEVGFKRRPERERKVAASGAGPAGKIITSGAQFTDPGTFPAALVLPDDDLAIDPEWPPHPVKEWYDADYRNPITPKRKTIYIIPSPTVSDEVLPMKSWRVPVSKTKTSVLNPVLSPDTEDMRKYLEAFYHGMTVRVSNSSFEWRTWEASPPKKRTKTTRSASKSAYDGTPFNEEKEEHIGLCTPSQAVVRIRCRPSPDGVSRMQVNLDDVLDAVSSDIPSDAYAVVMVMQEDMWEGDDDIFTGGRAYGSSRIAVVSAFRDHPDCAAPDDGHTWPFSHCASYIDSECAVITKKMSNKRIKRHDHGSPLCAAITAALPIPPPRPSAANKHARWLSNIAQTISHELGHCFGLDHCVYFACAMQGCASSAEAQRQPPYLCPVCLQKVATGIGEGLVPGWGASQATRKKYVRDRYEALMKVCGEWDGVADGATMFAGYRGWLEAVLGR